MFLPGDTDPATRKTKRISYSRFYDSRWQTVTVKRGTHVPTGKVIPIGTVDFKNTRTNSAG